METTTENGAGTTVAPVLRSNANVRFGPRDNQVLRLDVAELLLTRWAKRQPKQFGEFLAAVLLGEDAVGKRARDE